MPEHIRALVAIAIIAAATFFLVRRTSSYFYHSGEFRTRVTTWFSLSFIAFFSFSFWLYALASCCILYSLQKRDSNRLALYCFLFFLLPLSGAQIPGFGLINYLFELNHLRILVIAILLPELFRIAASVSHPRFGRLFPDKVIGGYLCLVVFLSVARTGNITASARLALELGVDVFIPYYVASRALDSIRMYKDVLFSYLVAALVISAIGFFEYSWHWLLYSAINSALGLDSAYSVYLARAGGLRAMATTGQSIVLGYAVAIAIAVYSYLQAEMKPRSTRLIIALILAAGMISSLARGPWLGAAVILGVFALLADKPVKRLATLIGGGVLAGVAALLLPESNKLLSLIPGLGKTELGSFDYRAQLFDNALIVIERNLWLGSADFLKTPEMEAMRQGQGIIDVVNSYLAIALGSGLIGLSLFVGFFVSVLIGIRRTMKQFKRTDEAYRLGQFFVAALIGTLVIIGTVSSITFVPAIYWLLAGLAVGYIRLFGNHRRQHHSENSDVVMQ